mmetsp:Transcript_60131/g.140539  ORF Transcript_60131/g.140539 Transcript_60131/m.140539 type:complete len:625 (+) Transcript_60131:53-1927(+)
MEPISSVRPGAAIASMASIAGPDYGARTEAFGPDYSMSPLKVPGSLSPDATISSPTLKSGRYGYGSYGSRETAASVMSFNPGQVSSCSSPRAPNTDFSTEVQRKAAEWERQIESLDAKELEIHQTQLRLIREQTAAFRADFVALRKELADTKAFVQRQQANASEQGARLDDILARERQERDASDSSLGGRVESLERGLPKLRDEIASLKILVRGQDVAGVLQAHQEELRSLKDSHADLRNLHSAKDQHHATMQQRVEYLEKMMGDSADSHAAHVKQLEDLRLSHDHTQTRHSNTADKLERLRQDKETLHNRHATFEERLMNLERFMTDSIDKHAKELVETRNIHGRTSADTQALKEKHATVDERLKFLEQTVGESAEHHERHAQEMKHAKLQLDSLHGKLSEHQSLSEGRDRHHASMGERLRFLEQALGDSADKHSRELKAHKDVREQQHASLEEKVRYLEKLIGDSADEHARKLEAHRRDLEEQRRNFSSHQHAFDEHKTQVKAQQAAVERHATFEQRLDFLERSVGDSAQQHLSQLHAAKAEFEQKHEAHYAAAGTLADRLKYLETWFGGLPGFRPPNPSVTGRLKATTRMEGLALNSEPVSPATQTFLGPFGSMPSPNELQ